MAGFGPFPFRKGMERFSAPYVGRAVILLFLLLLLNGCTLLQYPREVRYLPEIESVTRPGCLELEATSLGIFPFSRDQRLNRIAYALAHQARKSLLKARFMRSVEVSPLCPITREGAIRVGREGRHDLALLLSVDSFVYGGLNADSRVEISILIIDTRTAEANWYFTGHLEGSPSRANDYLFFLREGKGAPCPYLLSTLVLEALVRSLLKTGLS